MVLPTSTLVFRHTVYVSWKVMQQCIAYAELNNDRFIANFRPVCQHKNSENWSMTLRRDQSLIAIM